MPGFTPMDAGYVMVAERHAAFVKDHPNGMIQTDLAYGSDKLVVVKAMVWKKGRADYGTPPDGTGMASMPIPGPTSFSKNSEVENAETSAVGRALAMIGYHAKHTMASGDEIAMKTEKVLTLDATTMDSTVGRALATVEDIAKFVSKGMKFFNKSPDPVAALKNFVFTVTGKTSSGMLTNEDLEKLTLDITNPAGVASMLMYVATILPEKEPQMDGVTPL